MTRLTVFANLIALCTVAGCSSVHKVGDLSSADVFADPSVRGLADAACTGDIAGINLAIQKGVNPDSRGLKETTPLLWALSCRNLSGVARLLQLGADPNLPSSGVLPIVIAAEMADSSFLEVLIEHGANPNPPVDRTSKTPLQKALYASTFRGNSRNLELLLQHGADVNAKTEDNDFSNVVFEAVALNRYSEAMKLMDFDYRGDLDKLEYLASRTINNSNIDVNTRHGMGSLLARIRDDRSRRITEFR